VKSSFARTGRLLAFVALTWLAPATYAGKLAGQSFEEASRHWAYQPIQRTTPPPVKAAERVQSPIDTFLLAKLEAKGLTFAPPADPRTLLRRVCYDLIGLPPTAEETEAFDREVAAEVAEEKRKAGKQENRGVPGPSSRFPVFSSSQSAAYARVVERLLASPRYGERWGRHWLDVARYAETKDLVLVYGKDALRPYAYTYRDYVIRAFNEDVPFNDFVRDQLAADLVQPKVEPWRLAALGYLTLGRLFDNNVHDQIDDQIDTVSRGLLGLTVACARCHDHKYDAISAADYYGLYGVFASTERPYGLPLIEDPAQVPGGPEFEEMLAKARKELEDHLDRCFNELTENLRQRIGDYLVRAVTTKPDLTETTQFGLSLTPEDFRPTLMLRTRRFVEQRAKPEDPIFGPWAALMALPGDSFPLVAADVRRLILPEAAEQGSKGAGVQNAAPITPAPSHLRSPASPNPLVLDALAQTTLTNKASIARTYGDLFRQVYEESKKPAAGSPGLSASQRELLEIVTGKDGPIWFDRRDTPVHLSRPDADKYGGLVQNLDKLAANATNPPPARAMVVAELPEPYAPRIFIRGSPSRPGEAVPRSFLRVLNGGAPQPLGEGSGRLALARAIASPTNPLSARVFVNRVWMEHFGEPLVSSPADFGVRSEPPTHPELLDWLAGEFIRSGWSVKHLHRVILTSAAFQQSSVATDVRRLTSAEAGEKGSRGAGVQAAASISAAPSHPRSPATGKSQSLPTSAATSVESDPDNRLLWHYPRRRLDLEAMRDTLLFVAGRLDVTMGGRSVDVAGEPLNARRTVYGLVDRQNLPGLFRSFDFAVPDQCVERRPKTTVPQQALFAMNSPFVMEQARALAAAAAGLPDSAGKATVLIRQVLGRLPTDREIARAREFVEAASSDTDAKLTPWEQFAQALLASNELVFLD
jgi:hypothetical protein